MEIARPILPNAPASAADACGHPIFRVLLEDLAESSFTGGGWLIVEPYAHDSLADNLNPVGRVYDNFSTLLCVLNALSQPGGYALGARAGEAAVRRVVTDAGFTRFTRFGRVAETLFNLVLEACP